MAAAAPVAHDGVALGTTLRVVVTEPRMLAPARHAVEGVVATVDRAASRFREDSEITAVNGAAGRATRVSPLFALAIATALDGARLTDGDVDPTVGRALRLAGYDTDFGAVPADGPGLTVTAASVPGWHTVRLDRVGGSVTVEAGVELDLGATAKALAADLAASAAWEAAGRRGGVLVGLGGDIAVAGRAPAGAWVVQVSASSADPFEEGAARIAVASGGIATSSPWVRRWRRGGVELHHIIDPRSGRPAATPWRQVTVVADRCVDANLAATAAVVRGRRAVDWLAGLGLPARLVAVDGCVVTTGGWPAEAAARP